MCIQGGVNEESIETIIDLYLDILLLLLLLLLLLICCNAYYFTSCVFLNHVASLQGVCLIAAPSLQLYHCQPGLIKCIRCKTRMKFCYHLDMLQYCTKHVL